MIILRQREFGLIGKLAARRINTLGNKQQDYIKKISTPRQKTEEEKQLTKKLLKDAKKSGVSVMNFAPGQESAFRPEFLTAEKTEMLKGAANSGNLSEKESNLVNTLLQGKKIINVHGKNTSVGVMAHELAHTEGNTAKGNLFYEPQFPQVYNDRGYRVTGMEKIGLGATANMKQSAKTLKSPTTSPTKPTSGAKKLLESRSKIVPESDSRFKALGMSFRNWRGYAPRINEESRASNTGLDRLKDYGTSRGLLKSTKQELGDALQTYKLQRRIDTLRPIAAYANKSVVGDVAGKVNNQLSQNTSNAINTVYRKGGRF